MVIAVIIGILSLVAIPLLTGIREAGEDRKAIGKAIALNLAKENLRILFDDSYAWWTDGISDAGGSNDDQERWEECLGGGATDPRSVRAAIWAGEVAASVATTTYLNPAGGTPAYMPTGYRVTLNGLRDKCSIERWDGTAWQSLNY